MFDNISQQPNQQENNAGGNALPNQNRNFNQSGSNPVSSAGRFQGVTDMFADAEKPAKPDILKPKEKPADGEEFDGFPPEMMAGVSNGHKIFNLLAVIIGLALLGAGGYFGFKYYQENFSNSVPSQDVESKNQAETSTDSSTTNNQPGANQENEKINNADVVPAQIDKVKANDTQEEVPSGTENLAATSTNENLDSDQDGLTDEEEEALGTSPTNVDTDGDGLSDREETQVYKTNPLNPDTDGDGFKDGDEVKNGFNPNGAGKLYDINQQP